ncbi:MAG: hypothetical protein AB8W78_01165 [Arsenophonus endosymbiont of Dermacentor nuttalli]
MLWQPNYFLFLMHTEQAGVDKAYLYRADRAEFGLFDNSAYASYYSPSILAIYSIVSHRDSSIVKLTATAKTGITTTSTINANNQINILITNHTVDRAIIGAASQAILSAEVPLQPQYYIDPTIPATLIDSARWIVHVGMVAIPYRHVIETKCYIMANPC